VNPFRTVLTSTLLLLAGIVPAHGQEETATDADINAFFRAVSVDDATADGALDEIADHWRDGYTPILIELTRVVSATIRERLARFLETQTGESFGTDFDAWRQWMWRLPYDPHPLYGAFKGALYRQIDPRMQLFFPSVLPTAIRLDEVEWGGVSVNGIPPLSYPTRLTASEATYLEDTNVVFGISINGESMAYPKRILAWHEMARDRIGGVELTIIYCTLCGTVLPYESQVGDELYHFGTSGLLYRSNKLFFDEETRSLWSTLEGRPVIGWLAGQEGVALRLRSSVTTTWGEWRRLHPETGVLSPDTGYDRDYSEGVAYRNYFATDALMFQVPETDDRLNNKDEVLVFQLSSAEGADPPEAWAISIDFLRRNRVYPFEAVGRRFLILSSPDGANRLYETGAVDFPRMASFETLRDESGGIWRMTEDALVSGDGARRLMRVTANRAFWFGWYAQFPETRLVY
jgi:Protein of unknown function (DUF3179)